MSHPKKQKFRVWKSIIESIHGSDNNAQIAVPSEWACTGWRCEPFAFQNNSRVQFSVDDNNIQMPFLFLNFGSMCFWALNNQNKPIRGAEQFFGENIESLPQHLLVWYFGKGDENFYRFIDFAKFRKQDIICLSRNEKVFLHFYLKDWYIKK